ncbi:stress-inducible protein [Streptomyces litmocidini]|uniref:universal stress protein n=1 Tax=Streptomyces litmocidini TaxID=67318 RepID=UPI00167CE553|nr:universal stress protein [Streptomyces litmocidini]GGU95450.1 stress-inducible protein [Streptomyces litmocidini]
MTQGVVVGLDGTDQADAAAQWAAEEAVLRGTGVRLVHVKEMSPEALLPFAAREPDEPWAEDLLARTAAGLRERHPDLSVTTRLLPSEPVASLVAAAEEGDLLVLGSRALGGTAGYLVGSVGMTVAGLVDRPVVLVRALGASASRGPVVVGVDLRQPVDTVLGFAFEEAARRLAPVQVVYAQRLPVYGTLGPSMVPDVRPAVAPEIQRSLDDLLEPWRAKFPDLAVTGRVALGSAGQELVHAAEDTALVVVGRHARGSALGTHIGSVAHAVLHHSRSPVALVPHD